MTHKRLREKIKQVGLSILYSFLTMEEENMARRAKYKLLLYKYIYINLLTHAKLLSKGAIE
jgi:hypothetical protein